MSSEKSSLTYSSGHISGTAIQKELVCLYRDAGVQSEKMVHEFLKGRLVKCPCLELRGQVVTAVKLNRGVVQPLTKL